MNSKNLPDSERGIVAELLDELFDLDEIVEARLALRETLPVSDSLPSVKIKEDIYNKCVNRQSYRNSTCFFYVRKLPNG